MDEIVMLTNSILLSAGALLAMVLICILLAKPVYAFPLYFILQYFESIFFQGSRARVKIAIQIIFFMMYFLTYFLRGIKNRRVVISGSKWTGKAMLLCFVSQLVFSVLGYINGYSIANILINNYKFVEIFFFYYVISTSVKDTNDMKKLLQLLLAAAMILGGIELITTPRGGIGLVILMCLGAIIFSDSIVNSKKHWKSIAIISTLVVVFSQARSYMIAYFLSIFIAYLFFPAGIKKKTVRFIVPFAIIFLIFIIVFSGSSRVSMLLSRIAGLGEGLDTAGGYRWAEFQVAFSKFMEEPLGRGFGFLEYTYIRKMGNFEWGDYMHIGTGEILLKTGFLGTVFYYYLTLKTAYLGYKHICIARQTNDTTLYAICVGGFAGLISRIVFYNMSAHNTYGYLFLPIIFADIYFDLYTKEVDSLVS